ncbi:HAD-IB family phosphatase [Thiotrichales bacterium 19S11-10]|nr:HAD-IB family phosphatase [Thiotrichales bacterium 19S11-10]
MTKATVLFDFDSTVIKGESFEMMLSQKLKQQPGLLDKITDITNLGMTGKIPFRQSINERFQLAKPTLSDIESFKLEALPNFITKGFKHLCQSLKETQVDLWIVSGGLKKVIEPFAEYLGIDINHIIAIEAVWDMQGEFIKLIESAALDSKVKAAQGYANQWTKPTIIIGDGYTDYQLKEANIADYFLYYNEHVKRDEIMKLADFSANNANDLYKKIINLLDGD